MQHMLKVYLGNVLSLDYLINGIMKKKRVLVQN
jgi:hypothetical protein